MLRQLSPLRMRHAGTVPHALYVQLSDVCNITCDYCPCPASAGTTPFMTMDVVERLASHLRHTRIDKVHLGGGEPTLHPHFEECARLLRPGARFLDVVTNGQWMKEETTAALASGVFDMVEISIDAGGADVYQRARVGAHFDRLVRNLTQLRQQTSRRRTRPIIAVRLMVRPSTAPLLPEAYRLWRNTCDVLFAQHIVQQAGDLPRTDIYSSATAAPAAYPRCSYPFRAMQVRADGRVPLCCVTGRTGADSSNIVGTIAYSGLVDLWHHPLLEQYRTAHRERRTELMPACHSCTGA